jgi:hypothetical protein
MGDEVAVRWTWRGTQQGPFLGIPPTGEAVVGSGIGLFRIANGRIVEDFVQEDTFGLLQQLGRSRRLGSQRAEAPSRNPAQGPSVVTVERATNLHRGELLRTLRAALPGLGGGCRLRPRARDHRRLALPSAPRSGGEPCRPCDRHFPSDRGNLGRRSGPKDRRDRGLRVRGRYPLAPPPRGRAGVRRGGRSPACGRSAGRQACRARRGPPTPGGAHPRRPGRSEHPSGAVLGKWFGDESRPEASMRTAITGGKRTWIFLARNDGNCGGAGVWRERWTTDRCRHGWRAGAMG